ncbi:MAG: hypothetical protein H6613_20640 [Ignavibacteriales bacterium]|nr:hypothetical protein [Ignavibacteriales bacterium]
MSESLINNHDELNICKYQVNFFQTELDIRSKAIGSKLDLNLMKIENNINFKTNKNKILIFADDATCTPCFHETIGLILNQRNESVDSDIVVILIVGSRNQNYTKKLCEKYLHELPVYSDSNFLLKKSLILTLGLHHVFYLMKMIIVYHHFYLRRR